jgi:hypothetical protein
MTYLSGSFMVPPLQLPGLQATCGLHLCSISQATLSTSTAAPVGLWAHTHVLTVCAILYGLQVHALSQKQACGG